MTRWTGRWARFTLALAIMTFGNIAGPALAQTTARIDEALQNITVLVRAERVGYATFWDGNKYVQCRRMPDRGLRCEAAGTSMQPSLKSILTGERLNRLAALGWTLDSSFGNYVKTFPAELPTARIGDQVAQVLAEAYSADIAGLEINTRWVADVPCPPRAGYTQNLAGSVTDSSAMRSFVVRACSYTPPPDTAQTVSSAAELIALHGAAAGAEIQRLRINLARRIWIVFDPGISYVQCTPETTPPAIYCEAQSAESWPALAAILTPERVSRLHQMDYADPGRAPNYWKTYPLGQFTDAAIAGEALTILYDVYGYRGTAKLKMKTE